MADTALMLHIIHLGVYSKEMIGYGGITLVIICDHYNSVGDIKLIRQEQSNTAIMMVLINMGQTGIDWVGRVYTQLGDENETPKKRSQ